MILAVYAAGVQHKGRIVHCVGSNRRLFIRAPCHYSSSRYSLRDDILWASPDINVTMYDCCVHCNNHSNCVNWQFVSTKYGTSCQLYGGWATKVRFEKCHGCKNYIGRAVGQRNRG